MLNISLEKVCFFIAKAREFDVNADAVNADSSGRPAGDRAGDRADHQGQAVLSDYPNDPTYEELFSYLSDLNRTEQVDLVALTWLGRGDFDKGEWEEIVAQAKDAHNNRTPQYLLGMPLLGDYLEEGCAQLGLDCAEFQENRL